MCVCVSLSDQFWPIEQTRQGHSLKPPPTVFRGKIYCAVKIAAQKKNGSACQFQEHDMHQMPPNRTQEKVLERI